MSKTLYMMVGLPGSGKSWYALHELKAVRRVNQDEMGRERHLKAFAAALIAGESVVVDRVNFDRAERESYIAPARQRGYRVVCVWFDVDWTTCVRRLSGRKGHPTVSEGDDHGQIVGHFAKMMTQPMDDEYDELRVVSKHANAKVQDIRPECEGRRTIVVGDIHGCFDEFVLLLRKCGYGPEDVVVSVGDLTDRGPKSRETLEWFRDTPGTHVTEGNHCNKLRRLWSGRKVRISNGLDRTIEQCDGMDHEALAAWMSLWPQIIRVPDIGGRPAYVVHAGVDGSRPIDRQKVEDCLYARCLGGRDYFDEDGGVWWYETLDGSFAVLSGHAIHDDPRPVECAYLLDGGAFQGGKLRALVIDGGETEMFEVDSPGYAVPDKPKTPVQAREELAAEGLIRKDELGDLVVYTYTDACVHGRRWDSVTVNSRGHVFNRVTGECVAWSFPKFFNVGETPRTQEHVLPWIGGYVAFEKVDGWLGNLYRIDGGYAISTRGSFKSPGAQWATQFLRDHHDLSGLPDEVTLVFELISPITRIIVDYGDKETIVLLAAFNRHTGEEYAWSKVLEWAGLYGFPTPKVYRGDIGECRTLLADSSGKDMEGFVVRFFNGLRVKVKGEDYLRRARIVSNMTPLSVWGAMSSGRVPDEYRAAVDADYREQLDAMADELEEQWAAVSREIDSDYGLLGITAQIHQISDEGEGRKSFAERVGTMALRHRRVMFARLDGRSELVDKYIMGLIRPNNNEMKVDYGN